MAVSSPRALLARLPGSGRDGGPPLGWAAAAVAAVSLAGLAGLGVAVVVVSTLDPTGGLSVGGSAALAGRLWLLANGAELELPSGPLRLAPLLLTLGIAWGLARAGRFAVHVSGEVGPRAAGWTTAAMVGLHTALTVLLGLVLDDPDAGVDLLRTAPGAAVLALVACGWGVLRESGGLDALLDRAPGAVRPLLRAVVAGVLTLLALCLAVVAVAVADDASGYAALSGGLGGAGAGALGLLGLGLLLLPNAAAAVLGLAAGPGFVVGTGTLVSVHGVTLAAVPALPLLAALPDTQAVPLLAFVSQAVPALAGLVTGAVLGRRMGPDDGGPVVAGLWGVAAGVLLGLLSAAGVWVAAGSLGDGALAEVGAPALATGIAVAAQAGIAAAVAATVSRWRSRADGGGSGRSH
ncbi:cell division protein PerM [Geodermatophilus sp. URMC 64]